MEAELMQLATAGATALSGLMVSEAWEQGRTRLARFFGRGGGEDAVLAADEELRLSQQELAAAREAGDEESADDIRAGWRQRLRRVLQDDPEAQAQLRELLAELAPSAAPGPAVTVTNSITGGTQYGTVIQGQNFSGPLTFGAPPGQGPAREPEA